MLFVTHINKFLVIFLGDVESFSLFAEQSLCERTERVLGSFVRTEFELES